MDERKESYPADGPDTSKGVADEQGRGPEDAAAKDALSEAADATIETPPDTTR